MTVTTVFLVGSVSVGQNDKEALVYFFYFFSFHALKKLEAFLPCFVCYLFQSGFYRFFRFEPLKAGFYKALFRNCSSRTPSVDLLVYIRTCLVFPSSQQPQV